MNSILSTEQNVTAKQRQPESAWLRIAKVLTLLAGLLVIFLGVMMGSLYLLLSLLAPQAIGDAPLNSGTIGFSMFAISLTLGGALVFQSVSALSKRPSSNFKLPMPSLFLLAFIIAVSVGVLISWAGHISWVLFPIFYVLGIVLPVGWVMSVIVRRLRQTGIEPTWRETILQFSCGAIITTSLALFLEIVVVVGMLGLAAVFVLLSPGGVESLEALADNLQSPGWIDSPANLNSIMFSPIVIASLFSLMSVAVPLIEEMVKAIGVIFMSYRRPSMGRALWWGLLGGAGFTLVEGLFNSNLAIGDLSWGLLAPMRFGTTVLHCTTGALMGLGWYALLQHKQFFTWLKRYAFAVGLHAIWNGLSLGLVFVSARVSQETASVSTSALSVIILTALLFLQTIWMIIILLQLTGKLSFQKKAEVVQV